MGVASYSAGFADEFEAFGALLDTPHLWRLAAYGARHSGQYMSSTENREDKVICRE